MNYQDIEKVNGEMKMLDLKGKKYAMVPERVTAFRKLYPDGFITTQVISHDAGVIFMQATVGYYAENGDPVTLATGFAQEVKGFGMVNKTSYVENCETSAVGRALGMLGLGINDGGGICSAEELANAVTAQNQIKEAESHVNDYPAPAGGPVNFVEKVPPAQEPSPVLTYLATERENLRKERGITVQANNKLFTDQKAALVKMNMAPDKGLSEYTMDEAKALIDAMYKNFAPDGTEVIKG